MNSRLLLVGACAMLGASPAVASPGLVIATAPTIDAPGEAVGSPNGQVASEHGTVGAPDPTTAASGGGGGSAAPSAVESPGMQTVSQPATSLESGRNALQMALGGQGLGSATIDAESFQDGVYKALLRLPDGKHFVEEKRAGPSAGDDAAVDGPKRASWVLVLAAEKTAAGIVWGNGSLWGQSWLAPQSQNGVQLVPTAGDSEDHRTLSGATLDGLASGTNTPAATPIARLAGKYRATTVAVVLRDAAASTVTVAVFQGGHCWSDDADMIGTAQQQKDAAAARLGEMLGSRSKESAPDASDASPDASKNSADASNGSGPKAVSDDKQDVSVSTDTDDAAEASKDAAGGGAAAAGASYIDTPGLSIRPSGGR